MSYAPMAEVAATDSYEPCKFLAWDTSFWGFPVARVRGDTLTQERVREIDAWCHRTGITCLYLLARLDDATTTSSAEDAGFRLTDVRLTFRYRPTDSTTSWYDQTDSTIGIRECCPEDMLALQRIAGHSHQQTRFYFDENFPRERCRLLYETWIRRSCEGCADKVLVAAVDNKPVGYVSCHLSEGLHRAAGTIGLVGVSDEVRGRGLGRILVLHALRWFMTMGVSEVTVVTQGRNYAAQALYQRCGFISQTAQLWYHKWYLSPITGGL